MNWAVGVTTVPSRKDTTFPRTLMSLRRGGFAVNRIFLDKGHHGLASLYENTYGIPTSNRDPWARCYANWLLGLAELYLRNPLADRYLMAQDDFVTGLNLMEYLEKAPYPEKGYQNLLTFPDNQAIATRAGIMGWFKTPERGLPPEQKGMGAVALVFSREAVLVLLSTFQTWERANCQIPILKTAETVWMRGEKNIDGGVAHAMNKRGWSEYCHSPSLVYHIGEESTIGHLHQPDAIGFPGETSNLLDLIKR